MPLTGRFLVFLAIAALCCPQAPAFAQTEKSGAATVAPYFRPGEARNRFEAWEKRARKFESALDAGYSPEQFARIAARLRLIAADIQAESDALTRRYDALLADKRKKASESAAKQNVLIELGYGPDELRYAANVAAYAKSLSGRFQQYLDAPTPAAPPAPPKAPRAPDPLP